MTITIAKDWDGNERVTEAGNGRTYVSAKGRWQWVVLVDGVADQAYDTKREAKERADVLRAAASARPDFDVYLLSTFFRDLPVGSDKEMAETLVRKMRALPPTQFSRLFKAVDGLSKTFKSEWSDR